MTKGHTLENNGPVKARLDEEGAEIVDSVPMAPPVGYKRSPTIAEMIRQQVRSALLAREAEAAGAETFEESDDFDVADDDEPLPSGYEIHEVDGRNAEAAPAAPAAPGPVATPTPSPGPGPVVATPTPTPGPIG